MNRSTKILIGIFLFVAGLYLVNKFFDTYRLRTPIILQNPFEKRKEPLKLKTSQERASGVQILNVVKAEERTETKKTSAEEAIYIYFGEDSVATAVAQAESGLNCSRVSPTSDYGLFQIHLPLHQWRFDKFGGRWDNCWDNAKVARQIFEEQSWGPWVAYTSERYKQFIIN